MEDSGSPPPFTSKALQRQKELCEEAMLLVNAGVAMQSDGDPTGAERSLVKAVQLMETALEIHYTSDEEQDSAARLNKKMKRYVKMIKSQRTKSQGNVGGKRSTFRPNIVEFDQPNDCFHPIMLLLNESPNYGDICDMVKNAFGFQEANMLNQREHLTLLLTNLRHQLDKADNNKDSEPARNDPQRDLNLTVKAIEQMHVKLFVNYKKWCKFVGQRPNFSLEPLADLVLFFMIWGEAGNFRQTPEFLCFLFHKTVPFTHNAQGGDRLPPGDFLERVIRPMYTELRKESDKKTLKGARSPHTEIRNYDDFNEFFWTKKCLRYDPYTLGQAVSSGDRGSSKIIKKTFNEVRSWRRAIISFRRVFMFTCALFFATIGFAINMSLLCPDSPIMYGVELNRISIFGKFYSVDKSNGEALTDEDDLELETCLLPKLATCLGVSNYVVGFTFNALPRDFQELLAEVPFVKCVERSSGRCTCYKDTLDICFAQSGTAEQIDEEDGSITLIEFNQETCVPTWRRNANNAINGDSEGQLNCGICQLTLSSIITNFQLPALLAGFIDFGRGDQGALIFAGGVAFVGIFGLLEIQNRCFSVIGIGFVGRSLHTSMSSYCRYTMFWVLLFACKLLFDYQFMIKSLVETTLFIWVADEDAYLSSSAFLIQFSFHNITYILSLWFPAFLVFMYDAQIFYAILSVVFGSLKGFNLRIGEVRSFRILRLTFKLIPGVFNQKIVPNITDTFSKKSKKRKTKLSELEMPVRRFERISYGDGSKPLTVATQKYSTLLEQQDHEDMYAEISTPSANEQGLTGHARGSNIMSITGVSGAAFERTIPFAQAWNRVLASLRYSDVISDRELNVLSYLIDSKDLGDRRLYPPAFLTAGKLDESIDIISECSALYEKLLSDKGKKKAKTLAKIESAMTARLIKDDLRVEAILGSFKFTSNVLKHLLGEEHRELHDAFNFMEESVIHRRVLQALNLSGLYQCRSSCADLMKAILDVPKNANETSIKFQRSLYYVIDNVENVMTSLKHVLSKQEQLVQLLNDTPLKPNSFFFPGDAQHYASTQLQKIVNDQTAMDIVSRAYQLLTVDNFDAEPKSEEGRRRLRFFVNSLFMEMPAAKPVRQMHSLSISTPYYNEIVMYSLKDLTTQNDDSIKLLFYLQTVYQCEWHNFLERIEAKDTTEAIKKNSEEVRLWASYRGQTLSRTVRGMMYNEDAIRFLYWLEIGHNEPMHLNGCNCNRCNKLDEMVMLKFNYVCTCQIYGKQKDEQRQQASDIDYLLTKHPNLRVAYVDGPKKVKDGPPKFFSVLIRSLNDKITEVYRVELPGDPIVGEGKPENQNHAIIFSRGQMLQSIDMNQDGYYEECLKMPNLLATADRHPAKRPLTIIGFREHVFTGGVSNLASFMSIQELSFVSLGQRMLAVFNVRMHYGHPDIFDKVFAMTTGGTAKASKSINLSEDIFAGFNTTLRGGTVSHEEFIQVGKGRDVGMQQLAIFEAKLSSGAGECVLSRDVMRMANRLDFFRLQSWFYGNLGWYFTQTFTVAAIYAFIYGNLYQSLSGLDSFFLERGGLGIGGSLNTSWALQMGFLLVIPVIAVIGVEKGFRHGITYLFWNILTLGPIFFTFQMGTRMHYFDRTLIHGGAKYRATGRGFTIKHEKFAELFRFYATSHFTRGVELAFLLVVFGFYATFSWCNCSWRLDQDFYNNIEPSNLEWKRRCYANHYQVCVLPTNQNYGIITFSLWIIAATWMWAPFFFNPSGLDWDKIIDDYNDWQNWLRTMNDSSESWYGWWSIEVEYLEHSSAGARFITFLRKSRFLALAVGIYLNMVYRVYYKRQNREIEQDDLEPFIFVGLLFVLIFMFLCCGYGASRWSKKNAMNQRKLRRRKFHLSLLVLVIVILGFTTLSLSNILEIIVILILLAYWFMQVALLRLQHQHVIVRSLAHSFDRVIGWIVFGPIMFIAMFLPFISAFQQRVMFNAAFTSGLEVSKLFSHDIAPGQQVIKVKKTKKKSKQRDE